MLLTESFFADGPFFIHISFNRYKNSIFQGRQRNHCHEKSLEMSDPQYGLP